MTSKEFAKQIGSELRTAHNTKSQTAVVDSIKKADETLAKSDLSAADKLKFWAAVRAEFYAGSLLVEKQANSDLHALMQSILAALAAREEAK